MEITKEQAQLVLAILPSVTLSGVWKDVQTKVSELDELEKSLTAFIGQDQIAVEGETVS